VNQNPETTTITSKPVGPEASVDYEEEEGISYSDKLRLSNSVKSLNQEQLGEVVNIIMADCSDAYREVGNLKLETEKKIRNQNNNKY
jgi:hypothetical protein